MQRQKLHLWKGGKHGQVFSENDDGNASAAVVAMRCKQWRLAAVLLALADVPYALTADASASEQIFVTARMPDYKVSHEDVRPMALRARAHTCLRHEPVHLQTLLLSQMLAHGGSRDVHHRHTYALRWSCRTRR